MATEPRIHTNHTYESSLAGVPVSGHPIAVEEFPDTLVEDTQKHPTTKPKKKLIRRTEKDNSQAIRRAFQFVFVAINVWVGVTFYLWTRYFETGGTTRYVERPAGVEGWLPIASLMNLKLLALTGKIPEIHPAGMFLLIAFLAMSVLFKKAFCAWLCPVGTLAEYLWKLGRKLFKRNFHPWKWIDIPLRGLKYLLLGFFLYFISMMSAGALEQFMGAPYALIADVKMLNFFRYMTETAAITIVVLVVLSMLIQNFWCRYLCPYGALMGLASLLSPVKIRRDAAACIDCAKCAKACPSHLPVDKLVKIQSAECTACLECVAVCPAEGALAFALPKMPLVADAKPKRVAPWVVAAAIAALFVGLVGGAKLTGHWNTDISKRAYMQLVPEANEASHPGF